MYSIEVYKTVDGLLFEDEDKATSHEEDLIGQEIDNLLRLVLNLDVNRRELIKGFAAAMKDKRELNACVNKLQMYLNFNGE